MSMRSLAVIAFSVLVAAVFWVTMKHTESVPTAPIATVAQPIEPSREELTAPDTSVAKLATVPDVKRAPATDRVHTTTRTDASADRRCHVFGRLVDDLGAPIPNLTARLRIYPVDPAQPAAKSTPAEKDNARTFWKTVTNASGRFSFEATLPEPHTASLSIEATEFHDAWKRSFGHADTTDNAPLLRGDNDLGDIVLPMLGAIEGRVVYHSGEPVEFADATLTTPTGDLQTRTDGKGRFHLQSVRIGSSRLAIRSKEKIELKDVVVLVERAAVTQLGDLTLPDVPTISGIVVDEHGAPIAGVELDGWPNMSGSEAQAKTRKDGTFTMPLPQPVAHLIEIERATGFEPWEPGADERTHRFDPGTKDVRIVLVHAQSMTFSVVDARTREPIPRFGLRVEHAPAAGQRKNDRPQSIRIDDHAGGIVEAKATPGLYFVVVTAPGHAPFEADVISDAGSPGKQTIALSPASTLRGRLVMGDAPLANVHLLLEKEWIGRNDPSTLDPSRNDLDSYAGRPQDIVSDAAGAFEFTELAVGTHRLEIAGDGLARTIVHDIKVAPEQTLDLGRIDIARGAELHVHFLTTEPDSPVGFGLWLDKDLERSAEVKDPDGTFVFKGLEAGPHALVWARYRNPSWSESDPNMQRIELAAGESREIVIDERTAWCNLVVHVTRDDKPRSGIRVYAFNKGNGSAKADSFDLGLTNADGIATRAVKGGTKYDIEVWRTVDCALAKIGDLDVPASGKIERTIELHTGTLVLEMPSTLAIPDDGYIVLHLANRAGGFVNLRAKSPHSMFRMDEEVVWTSRTVDFGEIASGEYDATVTVGENRPDPARTGSFQGVDIRPPAKFVVKIEPDREVRVTVP